MISLKDYLAEAKLPDPFPNTLMDAKEVQSRLGARKWNAMIKHKWFTQYSSYQKFYKYSVSDANFQKVEVYPYFPDVHRTPEGKIRPDFMLQFDFGLSTSIINVHKFRRKPDDPNWYHTSSLKEVE